MVTAEQQSHVFTLQLQIKIKKQVFDEAIRNDKEFSEVKRIYMELKSLENQLEEIVAGSQKQYQKNDK